MAVQAHRMTFRRLLAAVAAGSIAALAAPQVWAAVPFPALDRPAVQLRTPQRNVLLAAAAAGPRLVAVGERGLVVLSDDGGASWRQAQTVPVSVTLTAVQFIDERLGWAVGHGGVVLRSEDAGQTWRRMVDGRQLAQAALADALARARSAPADAGAKAAVTAAETLVADGPDKPLLDVHFLDARHGWVIGAYGLIFETTDGGVSWRSAITRLDNPGAKHLYAMAVRGRTMLIAGEQGALFRSRDAGASFEPLVSPYKGTWFTLVRLPGQGLIVAGLRGNALYSPDDGSSWTRIEGAPPVNIVGGIRLADDSAVLCNQAGQLLGSREGSPFVPLASPVLTLPTGLVAVSPQSLLVVGMTGATRVPVSLTGKPTAGAASLSDNSRAAR